MDTETATIDPSLDTNIYVNVVKPSMNKIQAIIRLYNLSMFTI